MLKPNTQNTTPKQASVSYRVKNASCCPVCGTEFHHEMLYSGRGRLISGAITAELRHLYKPNPKYGPIYPQAYSIITCPECLYSSFADDFSELADHEIQTIRNFKEKRCSKIKRIFGPLSFHENRNLILGAASYILALDCYQKRGLQIGPTPKKAICSLRGAWLCHDIDMLFPNYGFAKIRELLYAKAAIYYIPTLEFIESNEEPQEKFIQLLGPDTDKNWGFEGVAYMSSYLGYRYAHKICEDKDSQKELIRRSRRNLSHIYGHGKVSRIKPSLIVNFAKDLHNQISKDLGSEEETEDNSTNP